MANIIIKSEERKQRERKILRDFGHNPNRADKATREHAECVAEKSREAIKRLEGMSK